MFMALAMANQYWQAVKKEKGGYSSFLGNTKGQV